VHEWAERLARLLKPILADQTLYRVARSEADGAGKSPPGNSATRES
jgi:hypothetical protein